MRTFQQHAKHPEPSIHAGCSPFHGFSGQKPCSTCQLISTKTGEQKWADGEVGGKAAIAANQRPVISSYFPQLKPKKWQKVEA